MKQVPLKVFPRQSLSVMLEDNLYELSVKECQGIMAVTVVRNGVTIVSNRRCVAGVTVIPDGYLEEGNFVILTDSDELPYFSSFDTNQVMVYLTLEEIEDIRSRKILGPLPNSLISGPMVDFNADSGKLAYGMTFTRTSTATYVSGGKVVTAAINVPRFEVNGLLREASVRNNLIQSGDMTNAVWTASQLTKTGGFSAPDSSNNAVKLIPNTTLTTHNISQTFTYGLNTTYIYSIYLKASGYNRIQMQVGNYGNQTNPQAAKVNLATGEVTTNDMSRVTIQALADGWYRVSSRITTIGTAGTITAQVWAVDEATGTNTTMSGDGTSGVLVWGGQLEIALLSAVAPTSYIPTVASTVLRAADFISPSETGTKYSYQEYQNLGSNNILKRLVNMDGSSWFHAGSFQGWFKRIIDWDRELTDEEKKDLGV